MHRTLFYIPHEFAGIPLFGFGWLLGAIVLYALVIAISHWRRGGSGGALSSTLMTCALGAVLVVFVFPNVEIRDQGGEAIGMAIRGYGAMMLTGVLCAVGLAAVRARRYGVPSDQIIAAAPWLFVLGILGARIFYVVEYRDQFITGDWGSTLRGILDFTSGGLVVYGSLIGGLIGLIAFCKVHRVPFFRMADIIIPCIFVGLCLGRIGCLMNGCCWGGPCEPSSWSLQFPKGSPVYESQMRDGRLLGLEVDWPADTDLRRVRSLGTIQSVRPGSLAEQAGLQPGNQISIQIVGPAPDEIDRSLPQDDTTQKGVVVTSGAQRHYWRSSQLPERAMSVRPAQLISSALGFVVATVLIVLSRFVHREGVLLGLGFAIYAVVRFGLETIRSDEPGQWGTGLTISQWVSVGVFIASIALILWRTRTPDANATDPSLTT